VTTLSTGRKVSTSAGMLTFERALARRGYSLIAGVDEAGRGACAGPLVAAAVILKTPIDGLADSKLLSVARRERLFDLLNESDAIIEVVLMSAAECDEMGVHRANLTAMRRAVARLDPQPDYVLTDGYPVSGLLMDSLAVWKGDRVSASISAASIVAKVTRDRYMLEVHHQFPDYGFDRHKGYGTKVHDTALTTLGPCSEHRLSYANVKQALEVLKP